MHSRCYAYAGLIVSENIVARVCVVYWCLLISVCLDIHGARLAGDEHLPVCV